MRSWLCFCVESAAYQQSHKWSGQLPLATLPIDLIQKVTLSTSSSKGMVQKLLSFTLVCLCSWGFFFLSIFVVVYVSVYSLGSQCVFWLFRHIPVTLSGSGLFSLVNIQLLDLLCSTLFFFSIHTPSSLFFSLSLSNGICSVHCLLSGALYEHGSQIICSSLPKGAVLSFTRLSVHWLLHFIFGYFFFSSVWIFFWMSPLVLDHTWMGGVLVVGSVASPAVGRRWTSGAAGGMDTAQAQLSVNSCVFVSACVHVSPWGVLLEACGRWLVSHTIVHVLFSLYFFF